MFFYLSKFISFFLSPLNWIITLLLWRLFSKSALVKKKLSVIIILFVLFFGNDIIYTKLANAWQAKPVQLNSVPACEAGILLGGLSSFDKNGRGFLNSASDRLVETIILYKSKKIKKIIISGGSVYKDRPKEADFLYKELLLLGIPPQDLLKENRSRTTFENALYTRKIVDSLQLPAPFLLITSAMHIPRAQRVFAKAGLTVIPFPADYRVLDRKFNFSDYFVPKLNVINDWSSLLKEAIGVLGYKIFNKA